MLGLAPYQRLYSCNRILKAAARTTVAANQHKINNFKPPSILLMEN
jgi:hypothetical protein